MSLTLSTYYSHERVLRRLFGGAHAGTFRGLSPESPHSRGEAAHHALYRAHGAPFFRAQEVSPAGHLVPGVVTLPFFGSRSNARRTETVCLPLLAERSQV